GAPRGEIEFDLTLKDADMAELEHIPTPVREAMRVSRVIGVAVGAGTGARCWPPERFAHVVDRVLERHPELLVAVTGTASEHTRTEQVLEHVRSRERMCNLAGQLSLGGLLALLKRVRLLLANDSAPAHFANALDIPSVVIFGSAHPSQWAAPNRVWHRAV